MTDDVELLRRYTEEKSEEAFAELVRRHIDFVYAAALRLAQGNAALAQDATQAVFTDLARKASVLARHRVVIGWLHTAARFAVAKAIRTESRRRVREQEAYIMNETLHEAEGSADWARLQPVLDEVLGELKERERVAILLRFFEKKPLAEVGAKLALSETAARSCLDRALEKMRVQLARRGVTSTGAALSLALANHVSLAAPAGLAASVTGLALTNAAAITAAAGTGAAILTFMSTAKILLGTGAALVALACGVALYQTGEAHRARAELAVAEHQRDDARAQLTKLDAKLRAEAARAQAAEDDIGKLTAAIERSAPALALAKTDAKEPITHDSVNARYKHGQELARNGDAAGALREFLWCFDEGMTRVSSFAGVRVSFLLGSIAKLGETYPEALAALRERRDAAEKRLLASGTDYEAATDFASLNSKLDDSARTLALYDRLAPDDERRRSMGYQVYELLLENRRYADAAQAKPFGQMNSEFERSVSTQFPAALKNSAALQKSNHDYVVNQTAENIEVLTGAGDLAHARALADKLFAYDGAPEIRATVQAKAERAGHPELLTATPKP